MSIKFYIPKNDPGARPSRRFRAIVPLKGMRSQDGVIGDVSEVTSNDIVVMAKKTTKSEIEYLLSKKIRYVFDICDDKFKREGETWEYACKNATRVVTTTPELAKQIKNITGIDSIIIDDPTEREREEPKFNPNKIVKMAHYGAGKSFQRQEWDKIVNNLPNVEFHITIGKYEKYSKAYAKYKQMKFYEWSYEKQGEVVRESDITIIPIRPYSSNVLFKSPNRIIDAIQQGRLVFTNPGVASYEPLRDFVIMRDDSNFGESLKWALNNKDQVIDKIKKGQDYILKHHTPEIIGQKWVELEKII